jgi:uncharacterized membrane protein (UPF0127 family)
MKKIILILCLLVLATACKRPSIPQPSNLPPLSLSSLQISGKTLQVEIKKTREEMQQGLSDRKSLDENHGMLFDFTAEDKNGTSPAFWMKGMQFNLDLIWIYKNKIIGITTDVPAPKDGCSVPSQTCKLPNYYPPSPTDWVLEVNAGWTKKNNIAVGDSAESNTKIKN